MGVLNRSPVSQPRLSSDETEPTDLHTADPSHSGVSSDETEPTDLHAADPSHSGVSSDENEPTDLHAAASSHSGGLNFASVNARSVCNKASMICDYIVDNGIDLLVITETWLTAEKVGRVKADLLPDGYSMQHRMRECRRGGGVAVVHRKSIHVKVPRCTAETATSFECLETTVTTGTFSFQLIVIYRPPNSDTDHFHDEFADLLALYAGSPSRLLIAGDFNIHWDDEGNRDRMRLSAALEDASLKQHVVEPTHTDGHIIDLIMTRSDDGLVRRTWVSALLSDHAAVESLLNVQRPPRQRKQVTSRCFKRINQEVFAEDVERAFMPVPCDLPLADLCAQFNTCLTSVLDTHAPEETKTMTIRPNCRWMDDSVRDAKHEKRRCERKWRKTGLQVHLEAYKKARDRLCICIRRAKERYEEEKVKACGNDQKSLFRIVKSYLGYDTQNECPIDAETMSQHFEEKIARIRSMFTMNSLQLQETSLRQTDVLFHFTPVSAEEVQKCIMKSPSKSCALDPAPTWLIKKQLPVLLPHITSLINASLSTCEVPAILKQALITPVLKKASLDPHDPLSYRPVSNLPFISKVLERIVNAQLTKHLDDNNLHHQFQSAYRAKHSVETALLRVQNDIAIAMDQKKSTVLLLLDLSAAFDTVDHGILIQRMQRTYGIGDGVVQWMRSYLSDREQRVKIASQLSSPVLMRCGVPQGSVLGPVLFSLYIGPLSEITRKWEVQTHQYADDCQLYISLQPMDSDAVHHATNKLQCCVHDIAQWMEMNKLKLNDSKTELIVFTSPRVPRPLDSISFDGTYIAASVVVRDLGFQLEEHLSAASQVDALCKSCFFHLANIGAKRRSLTRASAEKLVHAFVSSKLDFCNGLLVGLPNNQLKKLQRVQNTAARVVTLTPKYEHITPVLRELHWLPICQRIKYKISMLTWKVLHDQGPDYLKELLSSYSPSRNLRSSSAALCTVPTVHSKIGERAFSHSSPVIWNSLPFLLRTTETLPHFKSLLKTHLFNEAFT